jgi:hypothetical protein
MIRNKNEIIDAHPNTDENSALDAKDGTPMNRSCRNRIMDEILREDARRPFSEEFGTVSFLDCDSKAQPLKMAEEQFSKNSSVANSFTEIDFNDESFSSGTKKDEEESNDFNYDCEESLKEAGGKFISGKNFQCPVKSCKKVYTSSYGLKYHMDHGHTVAKTTEKRPYVCNIENCGKTYKNNNGLKYHIAHAHKGVVFNESEYTF